MTNITYTFAACSDKGTVREKNEDNFYIQGQPPMPAAASDRYSAFSGGLSQGVAGVFDGMGGEAYGGDASSLVARMLSSNPNAVLNMADRAIPQFVNQANNAVLGMQKQKMARIGTTMTVATINDMGVTVYNLGDSPAFLFSRGKLIKLSRDHTVVEQLVSMGVLSKEQAQSDKRRHQITQYIGLDTSEVTLSPHNSGTFPLSGGDCVVLCSDGVTDGLSEADIASLCASGMTAEKIASGIVDEAKRCGSRDNITAVVIKASGGGSDLYDYEPTVDDWDASASSAEGSKRLSTPLTALLWIICACLAFGLGWLWTLISSML